MTNNIQSQNINDQNINIYDISFCVMFRSLNFGNCLSFGAWVLKINCLI